MTTTAKQVEFEDGGVVVDAALVSKALGLDPRDLRRLMQAGEITSACETGEGEDAGFHRLTFFHGNRRLRLIVAHDGQVIRRSLVDFGERALPATLRRRR